MIKTRPDTVSGWKDRLMVIMVVTLSTKGNQSDVEFNGKKSKTWKTTEKRLMVRLSLGGSIRFPDTFVELSVCRGLNPIKCSTKCGLNCQNHKVTHQFVSEKSTRLWLLVLAFL